MKQLFEAGRSKKKVIQRFSQPNKKLYSFFSVWLRCADGILIVKVKTFNNLFGKTMLKITIFSDNSSLLILVFFSQGSLFLLRLLEVKKMTQLVTNGLMCFNCLFISLKVISINPFLHQESTKFGLFWLGKKCNVTKKMAFVYHCPKKLLFKFFNFVCVKLLNYKFETWSWAHKKD